MAKEIAAPILDLNPNPLPAIALAIDAAFGLATRKRHMNSLNEETQLVANHAEEAHYALLTGRSMSKSTEADRCTVLNSVEFGPCAAAVGSPETADAGGVGTACAELADGAHVNQSRVPNQGTALQAQFS